MPTTYQSPGVYVEEVPSTIKPIAGVSMSTAGFIGVVPDVVRLPLAVPGTPPSTKWVSYTLPATTKVKTPVLVTSWAQFTRAFGDFVGSADLPVASGGTTPAAIDEGHSQLAHAVYGFFNNGGSRCYVARVTAEGDIADALKAFAAIDEIALVAAPGRTSPTVRSALVSHCENTRNRFAILDGPKTAPDLTSLTRMPAAATDTPATPGTTPPPADAPAATNYAAWYFPWIQVFDPGTKAARAADAVSGVVAVPPSGHIAGIYARVDNDRGVHKAPANEVIMGALGLTQAVSRADQDGLNPKGVNCLRLLNSNILVWGARTVGGDGNADLKYINVRRMLLFLRKSIEEGTQWVVFEPNTPALWQKVSRNVTAFLTNVWRSGALFGTTAQEAFYVRCDENTNPAESRDAGLVVTEIGVAIVRPAEFVVFRISQSAPPTA